MRLLLVWIFLMGIYPSGLLAAGSSEFLQMIRASQNSLAQAQPQQAEALLAKWEIAHPEVRDHPTFCYQRFFVALEGRGDRATARDMLARLTRLVESGAISAHSAEYLSVTEAWYRSLFSSNSDLCRQANRKMTERLALNAP